MLRMVAAGADDHALQKHCKEKLGFHVSVRALCDWRNAQLEARGVAALKAAAPKIELVVDQEIDELLKFKGFCLDTALRIWKQLPAKEKYTARNAFKFLVAYQRAQAQVFILHGLSEAAKAGQTMENIGDKINERLERLSAALTTADEDTQPPRDE